jgi:hypothetical protein
VDYRLFIFLLAAAVLIAWKRGEVRSLAYGRWLFDSFHIDRRSTPPNKCDQLLYVVLALSPPIAVMEIMGTV